MIQVRKRSEITQEKPNNEFNDNNVDTGLTDFDTLVLQLNDKFKESMKNLHLLSASPYQNVTSNHGFTWT